MPEPFPWVSHLSLSQSAAVERLREIADDAHIITYAHRYVVLRLIEQSRIIGHMARNRRKQATAA